jgi:tetratricopeptide (TPR) repeat protein
VIATATAPTGRPVAIRASTGLARLRAARLVAAGDAQLRKAAGDREQLTSALASYRQAAAAAPDQPDTHVRQAIVLVALERATEAESSIQRAIAVDRRLSDAAAPPAAGLEQQAAFDPVFDRRPTAGGSAIARRGADILRQIGGSGMADQDAVAWLADRWSDRERQAAATVATTR